MTNLYNPPSNFILPLTKGQGISIDFTNQPGGAATPYATTFGSDVTVTLIIEGAEPVTQAAVITAEHAVVKVEPAITDLIATFSPWRLVIASTIADPPVVPCNGKVTRFDG